MPLTETGVGPEFLLSEAPNTRSREQITLHPSGVARTLAAGTVLGLIDTGALSAEATAFAGNTGNGAMGAITVAAGTPEGTYKLIVQEPGSNVGNFVVEDPEGVMIGQGDVATAFSAGGLGFTLADGATDFVAGDGFDIVVTAAAATGETRYGIHDPEATNGLQNAKAILYAETYQGAAEVVDATAIVRDAEVILQRLVWDDQDSGEKTAALAQLAEQGVIVRD